MTALELVEVTANLPCHATIKIMVDNEFRDVMCTYQDSVDGGHPIFVMIPKPSEVRG